MIDQNTLAKVVEEQIVNTVNEQIAKTIASQDWLQPLEQKVIQYSQDKILTKFSNSSTMPEIITAVKQGVVELFQSGIIPGIDKYVDHGAIKQSIDIAVQDTIESALDNLSQDPEWLAKVEKMVIQAMVQRTVAQLGTMDVRTIVENYIASTFANKELKNFATSGFEDRASQTQVTIMDETTVVENELTARDLNVIGSATVKDLIVKGSINTDNHSWDALAGAIGDKALASINDTWRDSLVTQVANQIREQGIDFSQVNIDGESLVVGNTLSSKITHSNLKKVGNLEALKVSGPTQLYETFTVNNHRVGINTEDPDSALSVWDEEIQVSIGKHKAQEAYIGTNRLQKLNLGTNREPQVTIDTDGTTTLKKLKLNQYQIGFHNTVPGWAGTRGDIVFNNNPTDNVFAWICIGDFKWKVLRVSE